jgi:hypothetical protein
MRTLNRIALVLCVALSPLGCVSTQPGNSGAGYPLTIYDDSSGVWVPAEPAADGTGRLPQADRLAYRADGPYPLARRLAAAGRVPTSRMVPLRDRGRIEKPVPEEVADRMRADALRLPPAAQVQRADLASGPGPQSPAGASGIDSLDYTDCCGGGGNVPADSELAVSPTHIIAVVNVAFEIYEKSTGAKVAGPTTFASFFSEVPNCSGVFDPNVVYDEKADRFILGIDANGADYCIAASASGDPTQGSWNRYSFATDVGRNFFDYPHAGVGDDAIYLGANMFGRVSFAEGRVWAIDKGALYAGNQTVAVVTRSTGSESTPQPMNLRGWAQGSWPSGGPHYILTDGPYDGANYGVWSWTDPFGSSQLVDKGTVNLNAFTGVTAGAPVDAPQSGGNPKLDGNDWRVQDAEYRNGDIWMANTIACNPGSGTVDCVRWARIDPAGTPAVIDAGVYASNGEYRIFADLAANDCNDMAVGYTKTSSGMYPAVYVSGRESDDPAGTLQGEVLVKSGEIHYTSFQSGTTHRWGDYTEMTIDPDGLTFWYMGQYSKNTGTTNGRWGNYIGSFTFADCGGGPDPNPVPGQASNPNPADDAGDVSVDAVVSWMAGANATSHKVYFGTSQPAALVASGLEAPTYDPGTLNFGTTYFWRVDEVNVSGTTTGLDWSFTTEAGGSGSTLVASSTSQGKTWTATVTAPSGTILTGTWSWSLGVVSCDANVCTQSGIAKKVGSVVFTADSPSGETVTVLKP